VDHKKGEDDGPARGEHLNLKKTSQKIAQAGENSEVWACSPTSIRSFDVSTLKLAPFCIKRDVAVPATKRDLSHASALLGGDDNENCYNHGDRLVLGGSSGSACAGGVVPLNRAIIAAVSRCTSLGR